MRRKGQQIGFKLFSGDVYISPEGGWNNLITGSIGVVGGLGNGDEVFCLAECFVFVKVFDLSTAIMGNCTYEGIMKAGIGTKKKTQRIL